MNKIIVLFLVVSAAMAWDPDAGPQSSMSPMAPQGYDDISTSVVADNVVSGVSSPRGIDYADSWGIIFMTDYGSDMFYAVDPSSGIIDESYAVDPSIPDILGIVYDLSTYSVFVNDWNAVMDMWYYNASAWSYGFPSPISTEPRGLALDTSGYIWGMDASTHLLYSFDTSGANVSSWNLSSDVPSESCCGCAVFPYQGDLGIVIGGYSWPDFYFFRWDGVNMVLLGSTATPVSATSSYGITYSDDLDTFFWLYKDSGSQYHLCQFDVSITALQRDTWAGIKTAF